MATRMDSSFRAIGSRGDDVEVLELSPHPVRVGIASLPPVQLQCLVPHFAGSVVLSERDMGVAEAVEAVCRRVGVVHGPERGERLAVVFDRPLVLSGEVVDVAEAVQGSRLSTGVVVLPY